MKVNKKISRNLILFLIAAAVLFCLFFALKKKPLIETSFSQSSKSKASNSTIENKPVNILFVGDIMLDRYIRQVSERKGYDFVFEKVANLLSASDFTVGNLEGPITQNQSKSVDSKIGEGSNYIFTFDPKISEILKKRNIALVNIGNNHIQNFGDAGVESTRKFLRDAKVDFFGDPEGEKNWFFVKDINGRKIAFVNYNQFVSNGRERVLNDIAKVKQAKADFIIVYTHWGTEFKEQPDEKIRNLAHDFIDSGADLIIGSHPHVIQSKEEYKGKMIYYSLGNFIFDQYFDVKTQRGLVVEMEIDSNNKPSFRDIYVKMNKSGQTEEE